MKRAKNILILITGLYTSIAGYCQSMDMYNYGILQIEPNGFMAVLSDFNNATTGEFENNGEVVFKGDFINEGITTYNPTWKGYTRFEGTNLQNISGSFPADFYDVLFSNPSVQPAFNLSANIAVGGNADFMAGVVQNNNGFFIFKPGATHSNTDHSSHVDGGVHKTGAEYFRYPIGHGGYYRYSEISASGDSGAVFSGKYRLENSDALYSHTQKEKDIQFISPTEYWELYKEEGAEDVLLTLSWNQATTPPEIIGGENIQIVRWSATENQWVNEGGVVDAAAQTVTTIAQVSGYGIFTLAVTDEPLDELDDEVIIFNGVTPNEDGDNDYFEIRNIQNYPDNRVMVFNRWGVKVFETTNYDSQNNVFKGYADARATMGSGFLPTGTYFYVVEYTLTGPQGEKRIKKAGHLYLKTD